MSAKKVLFSTYNMVMMALFAALIGIAAYISIPLPLPGAPHLTLQNFMILLVALLFPMQQSALIVLVWMLLGAMGLPLFIGGKGGLGYLFAPWGGYTVAFLLVALLLPLLCRKAGGRMHYTAIALLGALLIDAFGAVWLMGFGGYPLPEAFAIGFLPFLPLDTLKSIAAAQLVPRLRTVLQRDRQAHAA